MTDLADQSNRIEDRLKTRVKSGKCLLCEEKGGTRGLCVGHYLQFHRTMSRKKTRSEKANLEARLIADGKLLASGAVRYLRQDNPFDE